MVCTYRLNVIWTVYCVTDVRYQAPSTDQNQICCASIDPPSVLMCQISLRSVYSVTFVTKSPKFCCFLELRHFLVSPCMEKGEGVCTSTNLPLSNSIKIVSVLQCLQGEIVRTNCVITISSFTSVTSKVWWVHKQKSQHFCCQNLRLPNSAWW